MVTPLRAGHPGGAAQAETTGLVTAWLTPRDSASQAKVLLADVSEFQPDIDDAKYLAWSKAAGIRAAYGDQHDDKAWFGGARRTALHAGGVRFLLIYQYLVAGQDGAAQADAMHRLVGKLQKGEVLVADFEEGAKPELTAWYNRMLALGYPDRYLWTYSGLFFGGEQGALPVQWLAAYQNDEPTSAHVLWQFSPSFAVPGIGTADCSVYHGTMDQLATLGYPGDAVPVKVPDSTSVATGLVQSVRSTGLVASFAWGAVTGHTDYHLQLEWYKKGFGWVLSFDQSVGQASQQVAVAPNLSYRWRVAAGDWSDWQEFST